MAFFFWHTHLHTCACIHPPRSITALYIFHTCTYVHAYQINIYFNLSISLKKEASYARVPVYIDVQYMKKEKALHAWVEGTHVRTKKRVYIQKKKKKSLNLKS